MCTIYCFFRLLQTFERIKKQEVRVLIALSANIKSQGLLFSLRKMDTKNNTNFLKELILGVKYDISPLSYFPRSTQEWNRFLNMIVA
jgi:hypothetical protein